MKIPSMRHPESEELLRYVDGESPSRAAGEIRAHLETCWECRVELEELQNTVGECVRYRKNTLGRHLPPPPAPWTDIYRGFAEIDASLDRSSFRDRLTGLLQAPMRFAQRWTPVTVALIVICVLFYRFRQTPSVQAAELLRKAIAAADAHPGKPRRIQIRTRDSRVARVSGANTDAAGPIHELFVAAHYDWNDPLSAKSYQDWRNRLAEMQDDVVEEQGAYLIRTRTASGELTLATLKIRMQDMRPVEERFEFRNREWVEITELADDVTPPTSPIAAAGEVTRVTPPAPRAASATIGDELQVLAALRQVDADLGDPIEVSRAGSRILVTGVGIAAQRKLEISSALSSQPRVVVRFSETAPAPAQPENTATADRTVNVETQQLQGRVAEQIGGRAYFTQLATQVLDLSEPMMSRAYALRRLAERIPIDKEAELSAEDWRVLRSLQQEHTEALRRQAAEIDRVLRPALAPVTGTARPVPDSAAFSGAWQPAAEELFQSARRVEKLLAVMFGAAAGEPAGDQLPAQLLSSLAELRARVDAYSRLPIVAGRDK